MAMEMMAEHKLSGLPVGERPVDIREVLQGFTEQQCV